MALSIHTIVGKLIVIEGIDNCGKSTQAKILFERLKQHGNRVELMREPGSTPISEELRKILLHSKEHIDVRVEALIFQAARASLYDNIILPKLKEGINIVLDRSFWSTLAYQSSAGWDNIRMLNEFSTSGIYPNYNFIIDVPVDIAMARLHSGRLSKDRIESKSDQYFNEVRNNYLRICNEFDNITKIDGTKPINDIADFIFYHIFPKLNPRSTECNCTDDDTCPLGRSSTIPRCTADDLADYVARRNRMARLEIERELAQLDNNPK